MNPQHLDSGYEPVYGGIYDVESCITIDDECEVSDEDDLEEEVEEEIIYDIDSEDIVCNHTPFLECPGSDTIH